MILEIPRIPPSPNYLLSKHWRYRHRNSQLWKHEIGVALYQAGYRDRIPYPKAKVNIERRSRGGRGLDPDNLVGSVKPVLDGLRYAQVLLDDSPDHIELTVTQSRGPALTRIHIEPIGVS